MPERINPSHLFARANYLGYISMAAGTSRDVHSYYYENGYVVVAEGNGLSNMYFNPTRPDSWNSVEGEIFPSLVSAQAAFNDWFRRSMT